MKTKQLAFLAILLSLALVLSVLEGFIPPIAFLPPGVKLGLSNIITMYSLFFLGLPQALIIALLKSSFVFITRGITASVLSLSGGVFSIIAMNIAIMVFEKNCYITSIIGAVFHNIGQIIVATLILSNSYTLYYIPIMVLFGIIAGLVTGKSMSLIIPALSKLDGILNKLEK